MPRMFPLAAALFLASCSQQKPVEPVIQVVRAGMVEEIRPGDVVWFAPGEKHWHGATATTAMTHIAVQEKLSGKVVDWMEHVSDQQYRSEQKTPR